MLPYSFYCHEPRAKTLQNGESGQVDQGQGWEIVGSQFPINLQQLNIIAGENSYSAYAYPAELKKFTCSMVEAKVAGYFPICHHHQLAC